MDKEGYFLPLLMSRRRIRWLMVLLCAFTLVSFTSNYGFFEARFIQTRISTTSKAVAGTPTPKKLQTSQNCTDGQCTRSTAGGMSEQWYLNAVKKLSHKKVTPSALRLEHSYFHPDSQKRFEINDKEILSPSVCSSKTQIIVLILSQPKTMASRRAIRMTWGSVASSKRWPRANFEMDVRLLFVVGVRMDIKSGMESPTNSTYSDHVILREEASLHDDILQSETQESYSNLTRKMILGFKWISKNCPHAKYVVKTDQDIFLNVPMIWLFLLHHGTNNSIYGHIYFHGRVVRRGRWGLSESDVPISMFPAYASGTCYVVSVDAVDKVLSTYYLFPYVSIEDAFITGIVASVAKIDRYYCGGFTHWSEPRPSSCKLVRNQVYTANRMDVTSMSQMWSAVSKGECHGEVLNPPLK